MRAWAGNPINYIAHHDVSNPQSATTKLCVVSNSSLNNNNSGWSYNSILPKGPNSLVPLITAMASWRSYEHTVVWDLSKAYSTVHTGEDELPMRRLVWRRGESGAEFETYGSRRMHFGDRPAMCGLEVANWRVPEMGKEINPDAAKMIRKGYVDDGIGGGSSNTVDRLIGQEVWQDGKPYHNSTISQILDISSFRVKVMVHNGEKREEVTDLLGSGVLGLPWDPAPDIIRFHLGVNIMPKNGKLRVGPELNLESIDQLDDLKMTQRLVVSQVYAVYDPLGLRTPIMVKFKILLQKLVSLTAGLDDELEVELAQESRAMLKEMIRAQDVEFP